MIAIDAMGGDFAPREIIAGVLKYVGDDLCSGGREDLCLFGPKEDLAVLESRVAVVDSREVIGMGDDPVRSVREKRDSSLVKAIKSECSAVISAGNSGAVMAAALFFIGREEGIERPALVGLMPAVKRPVVCLDLGANPDCKAKHLYQFAKLGVRYAQRVTGRMDPVVGLLSNGEERAKGNLVTKEAFSMLERDGSIRFVGNVEPIHVFTNKVDVVVSDGFSGNVFLKTVEAIADIEKDNLIKLRRVQNGGALLVGIKKPVVVMHGDSTAQDVVHAIEFTQKIVRTWRDI